jgi:5'-nucleotidase
LDFFVNGEQVENRCIIKSGTDFRQFSEITMRFSGENEKPSISVRLMDVTSQYDEDVDLKKVLDGFAGYYLPIDFSKCQD